ncbi:unnamed protein product [Gadus morhua 'NCC']
MCGLCVVVMAGSYCVHGSPNAPQVCGLTQPQSLISLPRARGGRLKQPSSTDTHFTTLLSEKYTICL